MALYVPIGCAWAFQVTMVKLGLIGWAHTTRPDMIGCFRLLEMAVMIGQCSLRQIRAWKYNTRLNDTNADGQAFFFLLLGVRSSYGQTSQGFLALEIVLNLWATQQQLSTY